MGALIDRVKSVLNRADASFGKEQHFAAPNPAVETFRREMRDKLVYLTSVTEIPSNGMSEDEGKIIAKLCDDVKKIMQDFDAGRLSEAQTFNGVDMLLVQSSVKMVTAFSAHQAQDKFSFLNREFATLFSSLRKSTSTSSVMHELVNPSQELKDLRRIITDFQVAISAPAEEQLAESASGSFRGL